MKILTRQGSLRTELFKEVMLHERVGSITFCYIYRYEEDGEGATEYQVQVPMTFTTSRKAKEAFRKYLRARNTGKESVSLLEFRCRWSKRTYQKILEQKKLSLISL